MADQFLNRGDAPLSESVWQLLDETVTSEVSNQLTVRRLLPLEGPYGLALKAIPQSDQVIEEESSATVTVASAPAVPLGAISSSFRLAARDIALYEGSRLRFDLEPTIAAARAVARKEDELLLYGSNSLGTPGLLNATGVKTSKLRRWSDVGNAFDDVSEAAHQLEQGGFVGPYALGLAPAFHSKLFRLYPQTGMTELAHLDLLVTGGIVKAPAIRSGGVLVACGGPYASVVVGQDLRVGFEGPSQRDYVFTISESVAVRLSVPSSICVLQPGE